MWGFFHVFKNQNEEYSWFLFQILRLSQIFLKIASCQKKNKRLQDRFFQSAHFFYIKCQNKACTLATQLEKICILNPSVRSVYVNPI